MQKKETVQLQNSKSPVPTPVDTFTASLFIDVDHKGLWYAALNQNKFYKVHRIPKNNGTHRTLHEPLGILRTAQEKVADVFLRPIPLGSHVGAYIEDRGVKYTSARHSGKNVVVELDIKDFFGNTSWNKAKNFFVNHCGQSEKVAEFLALILTVRLTSKRRGMPQGSPASPMICNHVADKVIDQPILEFLKQMNGWEYSRYSDNLIFSSDTTDNEEVKRLIRKICYLVSVSGYKVNKNKTKTLWNKSPNRPQKVLGLTLNSGKANIPRHTYLKLRALVNTATKEGWDKVHGVPPTAKTALEKYQYVLGVVGYYQYINPSSTKINRLWSGLKAVVPNGTDSVSSTNTNVGGGVPSNDSTTNPSSGEPSQGNIYDTSTPGGSGVRTIK